MKITVAKFLRGVSINDNFDLEKFPHFVVVGRSNVGKSSFINSLTNHPGLCRTGSTPGLTREANLFILNKKIYLSDLPGYGYAKLSRDKRMGLEDLIFWYIGGAKIKFTKVFQLVDGCVGPTPLDVDMYNFLIKQNLEVVIIATKIDRVKQANLHRTLHQINLQLPGSVVIAYSTKSGIGKKQVEAELEQIK